MRIVCTILTIILFVSTQISAQSETSYDIEHECICLIDSIAPDTIVQFWRFTQSNNPGEYTVDVTFDFGSSYLVEGTLLSCKDYYLGDNPGGSGTANTLTMWTGTSSLGNSSVTQSGTILSSSLTGSFRVPIGTNAQEPVWTAGMIRYDTDDAAFEGYQGSEFFFAEAATNNLTSTSVLIADANGRITEDNANFYYTGDILYLGTSSQLRIRPAAVGTSTMSFAFGTAQSQGSSSIGIGWDAVTTAGAGYDAIAIGKSASATGGPALAIGNSATANAGGGAIAIGPSSTASGVASTAIGNGATTSSTGGVIAIGNGATATQPSTTSIGGTATATSGVCIGIGSNANGASSIALGTRARALNTSSVAIGDSTVTTAAFQFVAGTISVVAGVGGRGYYDNVYFGSGVTRGGKSGAGISYTINGSGANGTDQVGGDITIAGGKGTGTGAPGTIIFSTSTAGASSSTLQTLTERARFNAAGRLGIGTTSPDSELEVVGKAKVTNLPDSLFQYEVRADANGRFARQNGAYIGTVSTSTDGSGDITVTHGMPTTPTVVLLTVTGTTPYFVTVTAKGATTFTVRFFAAVTGLAVASTAVTFDWLAKT